MNLDLSDLKNVISDLEDERSLTFVAVVAGDKWGGVHAYVKRGQYTLMKSPAQMVTYMDKVSATLAKKYAEVGKPPEPWFDLQFIKEAHEMTGSRASAIQMCRNKAAGRPWNVAAVCLILDGLCSAKVPIRCKGCIQDKEEGPHVLLYRHTCGEEDRDESPEEG